MQALTTQEFLADAEHILNDGEATLKRVKLYPDRIILESANPLHDPLVFRGEEMNNVRIQVKAVAFISIVQ